MNWSNDDILKAHDQPYVLADTIYDMMYSFTDRSHARFYVSERVSEMVQHSSPV